MSRGRFSKITRAMWGDEKFRALSAAPANAQTLWLRLLTGPELTPIPGLFSAWEAGLAQALGWTLEGFRKAFAEVSAKGLAKADWNSGVVWVPNAIAHNEPQSPNVVRGWGATWSELPGCELKREAHQRLRTSLEGMGEAFAKAFAEVCPHPSSNQEQEQEQEQEEKQTSTRPTASPPIASRDATSVREVFDHWAAKRAATTRTAIARLKLTKDRRGKILARLREGYTADDLRLAVDGIFATDFNVEKGFTDVELACRDAAHVDRFAETARARVGTARLRAVPPAPEDALPDDGEPTRDVGPLPAVKRA